MHRKAEAGTRPPVAEMVELSISACEQDMMPGCQLTLENGLGRL